MYSTTRIELFGPLVAVGAALCGINYFKDKKTNSFKDKKTNSLPVLPALVSTVAFTCLSQATRLSSQSTLVKIGVAVLTGCIATWVMNYKAIEKIRAEIRGSSLVKEKQQKIADLQGYAVCSIMAGVVAFLAHPVLFKLPQTYFCKFSGVHLS